MSLNMDASKVSEAVYIRYDEEASTKHETHLRIICNWCEKDFYRGVQESACDMGNTWLADAITHIATAHPKGHM